MSAQQKTTNNRGLFVTFEGGEGAGKSTIIKLVAKGLHEHGHKQLTITREPGGSFFGPQVRNILLDRSQHQLISKAEALLFAADRAQHASETIRPALHRGEIVLCDRYIDSSVAYQGIARNLHPIDIQEISLWATDNLMPELTIILDIPAEVGLARKHQQSETNRMEDLSPHFHRTVREAFLSIAKQNPHRCLVVDATKSPHEIAEQVVQAILTQLP